MGADDLDLIPSHFKQIDNLAGFPAVQLLAQAETELVYKELIYGRRIRPFQGSTGFAGFFCIGKNGMTACL